MECGKIQGMLTPYLEGAVTPEQEQLVRNHLSSCERCRCAMDDLRKTGALVKDLEEIEPPPWLTQKIMTRVRDEAEHKGGVLRWLFHPFHVKIPLQAFAAILIVGFAVFLYKVNAPRYEAPKEASGTGAPTSSPEGARRANDAPSKHEEVTQETENQLDSEKKRRAYAEKSAASQGPAALSRQQSSPERSEESQRDYVSKPPLPLHGRPLPSPPQESFARAYPKTEAVAPSSGSVTRMKSERIDLTVRVTDVTDAARKIEKLLDEVGAHQVTRESREGRESISAELKGENLKGLLQKLSGVGDTLGSASDTLAGETVAVRIDLFEVSYK